MKTSSDHFGVLSKVGARHVVYIYEFEFSGQINHPNIEINGHFPTVTNS